MERRLVTTLILLVALLSTSVLAPVSASARSGTSAGPRVAALQPTANPFSSIPVSGTVRGGGVFSGILDLQGFNVIDGRLVATGVLTGTLTNAAGQVVATLTGLPVNLPLTRQDVQATCTLLTLDLGPLHLDLLGLVVDLNAIHLTITAQQGAGNLLGNLLCAVANLLNIHDISLTSLANVLDQVLGVVQLGTLLNPLGAIPLTGQLPGHGLFNGLLALQNVTVQGNHLVASGVISGTLTDEAGHVLATVNGLPVMVPLRLQDTAGTCQILTLDLGPIDLNLLGLHVHLSPVHLTITAQQGPGNLLGTLLCDIANLLNGHHPNPAALAAALNNLLNGLLSGL